MSEPSEIAKQIISVYEKWLSREIRLFPLLIAYTYFMNVDPIVNIVLSKFRDTVQDIVEFKQDLSNVRRTLYSSAVEDYESPIIRDITFIDKTKAEVCRQLSDKYCREYEQVLEKILSEVDLETRVKLGIVLRVFDRQRLLENTITRLNVRFDILQGWVRGLADALQDLGYSIDVERLRSELSRLDLFDLVNLKVPIGYASADSVLYPTCLEDFVNKVVREYGNVHRIAEVFKKS